MLRAAASGSFLIGQPILADRNKGKKKNLKQKFSRN